MKKKTPGNVIDILWENTGFYAIDAITVSDAETDKGNFPLIGMTYILIDCPEQDFVSHLVLMLGGICEEFHITTLPKHTPDDHQLYVVAMLLTNPAYAVGLN